MKEEDYSDEEIEELDSCLNDEWNREIYEEVSGEDNYKIYEGLFEPLEFFRLLYAQVAFIKENKALTYLTQLEFG